MLGKVIFGMMKLGFQIFLKRMESLKKKVRVEVLAFRWVRVVVGEEGCRITSP